MISNLDKRIYIGSKKFSVCKNPWVITCFISNSSPQKLWQWHMWYSQQVSNSHDQKSELIRKLAFKIYQPIIKKRIEHFLANLALRIIWFHKKELWLAGKLADECMWLSLVPLLMSGTFYHYHTTYESSKFKLWYTAANRRLVQILLAGL